MLCRITLLALCAIASCFAPSNSLLAQHHAAEQEHTEVAPVFTDEPAAEQATHASDDAADVHQDAHADHDEKFNVGDFIVPHIADAHDIHLFSDIHLPLPVIIYTEQEGLVVVMSSVFEGHGHGHRYYDAPSGARYIMYGEDVALSETTSFSAGSIALLSTSELVTLPMPAAVFDLSITKSVMGMLVMMALMLLIFVSVARSYKGEQRPPKGLANFFEPLIIFIRDDIAVPSLGNRSDKFLPFLLTIFFFILFSNLLGLIPFIGGFNITGTIGVTLVLAVFVFILTTINGNRNYWGHMLWPSGIPFPVKLILVPIEVLSMFMKPTVLMIRLTSNVSAGHIIILSFVSLVFIFKQDFGAAAGHGIGIVSVAFMVFMYFLELLVAFLQAYVFTLLAAIYFGEATQEAHH
jgi:F-type H+-transporting ATPase subunit a